MFITAIDIDTFNIQTDFDTERAVNDGHMLNRFLNERNNHRKITFSLA